MTTQDLHPLLDELADTREVVIRRVAGGDGQLAVWREAEDAARRAYADWCVWPGATGHAAFLAATDQADAAAESLRA